MPHPRLIAALLVLALAAGCSAPPQAAAPTAPPAPTQAPQPSATAAPASPSPAPQPSATAQPSPTAPPPTAAIAGPTPPAIGDGPLPAPLYLIDSRSQQVVRLEPDGRTVTQVTFEAEPVLELAVAAEAGTLAYVVGEPDGAARTLVLLDGGGRRERLSANISSVAISPGGERVVYRLDEPEPGLIIGQDESPSGVWSSLPYGPGRPGLVRADDPADGAVDDTPAWRYSPVAFSPDGARLALYAYDADGPAIPGGQVVILGPGPEQEVSGQTCCELPVWSADGASIYNAGGGPGPDLRYGLFRLDAASGAEAPVLEQADDGIPLVTLPHQPAGGAVYAFAELAPADGFSWEYPFQPRLSRVDADGALTPLSRPVEWPAIAVWDAAGRGAVVAPSRPDGTLLPLVWVPAADVAPTPLGLLGRPGGWAPGPLAAGDCAIFEPVAYQPPAARQFSSAARDVQARLAALGLEPGPADGFYGDNTRAAVAALQRERGLPESGDVDCATWQALLGVPLT